MQLAMDDFQYTLSGGFPGGASGKETTCQHRRCSRCISGLGRSPGGGNGNPFQYSCLKNPMDRGAWQARVHGVTKSWTQLKQLSSMYTSQWQVKLWPHTHTHTHTHTHRTVQNFYFVREDRLLLHSWAVLTAVSSLFPGLELAQMG